MPDTAPKGRNAVSDDGINWFDEETGARIDPTLFTDGEKASMQETPAPAAPETPWQEEPAWLRLAKGWWRNANPAQLGHAALHPLDTIGGIAQGHAREAQTAWQKMKDAASGDMLAIPEAIGHAAAAALPLLGPAAAAAGERGATGDIAGAVGEGLGLLTPAPLSHAGPLIAKAGRAGQVIDKVTKLPVFKKVTSGHVMHALPMLYEASQGNVPGIIAAGAAPFVGKAVGKGLEKAGNSLSGLRGAITAASERAQSRLGLDPLAEALGFETKTPIDPKVTEAAHRARTAGQRLPGKTNRERASQISPEGTLIDLAFEKKQQAREVGKGKARHNPNEPAERVPGFDRYGGPEVQAPEGGAFQGDPALPIEQPQVEPYGGPHVETPEGGAFNGEPALPIEPTAVDPYGGPAVDFVNDPFAGESASGIQGSDVETPTIGDRIEQFGAAPKFGGEAGPRFDRPNVSGRPATGTPTSVEILKSVADEPIADSVSPEPYGPENLSPEGPMEQPYGPDEAPYGPPEQPYGPPEQPYGPENRPPGIRAFHGSAADFDRFDRTKIGTGSGAQAAGHGLYFADQESVARAGLAPNTGHMYEVNLNVDPTHLLDWDAPLREQSPYVAERLAGLGETTPRRAIDMSREELIDTLRYIDPNGTWTDADMINEYGAPASLEALLENAQEMGVDDYLQRSAQEFPDASGQSLYRQLTAQRGGGNVVSSAAAAQVADLLRERGIPGVRYLENEARLGGTPSSNYSIFDDALIDILQKRNLTPEGPAPRPAGFAEPLSPTPVGLPEPHPAVGGEGRTVEGHPFTRLNTGELLGEPPLSPSLQKLADLADQEPAPVQPETPDTPAPGIADQPLGPGEQPYGPDVPPEGYQQWAEDIDSIVHAAREEGHSDLFRQPEGKKETPGRAKQARAFTAAEPVGATVEALKRAADEPVATIDDGELRADGDEGSGSAARPTSVFDPTRDYSRMDPGEYASMSLADKNRVLTSLSALMDAAGVTQFSQPQYLQQMRAAQEAGASASTPAPRSAPRSATGVSAPLVYDLMQQLNGQVNRGALVDVAALRSSFEQAHPGVDFNAIVQGLIERGELSPQTHAWPGRLTDADKARMLPNGRGGWFDVVGLPESQDAPASR